MARKSLDELLAGVTRFGRLTVLNEVPGTPRPGNGTERRVRCACDCGRETTVYLGNLRRGKSTSCGCVCREINRGLHLKHGDGTRWDRVPEYRIWAHMIGRCENPNDGAYHNYGGRGIKVCPEWRASYATFLANVGRRPSSSYSIDRIDNDGDYEPGNVRWATKAEQVRNVRFNRMVRVGTALLCLKDAARAAGLKRSTLEGRLNRGWSDHDAVTLKIGAKR